MLGRIFVGWLVLFAGTVGAATIAKVVVAKPAVDCRKSTQKEDKELCKNCGASQAVPEDIKNKCLLFGVERRKSLEKLKGRAKTFTVKLPSAKNYSGAPELTLKITFTQEQTTSCAQFLDIYLNKDLFPQQSETLAWCVAPGKESGSYLSFKDFNFDGYLDLVVQNPQKSEGNKAWLDVFLYDPAKKIFAQDPSFPEENFPELDFKKKLIYTHLKADAAGLTGGTFTYRYLKNQYFKTHAELREYLPDFMTRKFECLDEHSSERKHKKDCNPYENCFIEKPLPPSPEPDDGSEKPVKAPEVPKPLECKQIVVSLEDYDRDGNVIGSTSKVYSLDAQNHLQFIRKIGKRDKK